MATKEEKENTGVSRREFLKNAKLLAGSVAGGMAIANLAAAGTPGDENKAKEIQIQGSTVKVPEPVYEVYNTDILVLGGGFIAVSAALEAFGQGANLMMVDKGPFGYSGGFGMNWDNYITSITDGEMAYKFNFWYSEGLCNQKALKAVFTHMPNHRIMVDIANRGSSAFARTKTGDLFKIPMPGQEMVEHGFSRHESDEVKRQGINVVDRTMITNLFMQDGRCIGAMGIHLPTGAFRVFRAKATILATGPCTWHYGWISVSPISLGSPDNTGDLDAVALRNGARITGCEFFANDLISIYPEGLAASYNGGIGADDINYAYICDKNGDFWMKDIPKSEMNRGLFAREVAKKILDGKGSPNGGVYVDCRSDAILDGLRDTYKRNVKPYKDLFGIDVQKDMLEVAVEWYESNAHPIIDENLATDIPGLYCPAGGGLRGAKSGGISLNMSAASLAAINAVKFTEKNKINKISWQPVYDEFTRLYEILGRKVKNPIRPHTVRHSIQKASYKALGPIRNAAGLESSIKELVRIRREDLPRMVVSTKTKVFNTEWKEAIENYNMIDLVESMCRAALMRTETRGQHYRSDFDKRDNENWLCNITVKLVNGKMQLEKDPIVCLDYTPDQVKKLIDNKFRA
ncbi:MAG: FAD-binding protein [Desulfobacterium sp.]|nr:FAD-binding protein [Desulfobacterium sp.]MBU3948774.1 FAD-binding protein [Pseudomonadota bacterium]MBU4037144.1 FAD-binding protein [Pseudomonadota bacterium]